MIMDTVWTPLSHDELIAELDSTEQAIARSRTFHHYTDAAGRHRARVSPELLELAEREHEIVTELRRRHRAATLVA